ncbi:MAG: DUF2155 domain-containing protein [Alphaproteobacteria bacterium]|nr:DUF2155 domain-containing protein [Alphaproteobacteria bacterium]
MIVKEAVQESIPLKIQEDSQSERIFAEHAVLRCLDKMTGRVKTILAPIGDAVQFGTLSIVAQACFSRPPEETPEDSAFLDVSEIKDTTQTENIFRGWMFSSSPALSAMEHPVYDIWVIGCKTK